LGEKALKALYGRQTDPEDDDYDPSGARETLEELKALEEAKRTSHSESYDERTYDKIRHEKASRELRERQAWEAKDHDLDDDTDPKYHHLFETVDLGEYLRFESTPVEEDFDKNYAKADKSKNYEGYKSHANDRSTYKDYIIYIFDNADSGKIKRLNDYYDFYLIFKNARPDKRPLPSPEEPPLSPRHRDIIIKIGEFFLKSYFGKVKEDEDYERVRSRLRDGEEANAREYRSMKEFQFDNKIPPQGDETPEGNDFIYEFKTDDSNFMTRAEGILKYMGHEHLEAFKKVKFVRRKRMSWFEDKRTGESGFAENSSLPLYCTYLTPRAIRENLYLKRKHVSQKEKLTPDEKKHREEARARKKSPEEIYQDHIREQEDLRQQRERASYQIRQSQQDIEQGVTKCTLEELSIRRQNDEILDDWVQKQEKILHRDVRPSDYPEHDPERILRKQSQECIALLEAQQPTRSVKKHGGGKRRAISTKRKLTCKSHKANSKKRIFNKTRKFNRKRTLRK
jgi:hypothetical protein